MGLGPITWRLGLAAVASAGPLASATTETPAELQYEIEPTSTAIQVDGVLEEIEWSGSLTIPLEYENDPGENTQAPVRTEALLTHDDARLYVAFRAFDPSPEDIRARLSDRDTTQSDDSVGIVLDTFNDQRRAFEFFVNPLGVQLDLFLDGVSDDEDESWDAIWTSAGRITATGYEVEMAIPFDQIRFPGGEGELTWGVDAKRYYPRRDRHELSIQPIDRDVSCYLCQVSKVTGFRNISPGRNVEIVPTVTSIEREERPDFPLGSLEDAGGDTEVGVTAKWGVTPNLILNAAINPDFSQVEADVAQLGVNEQFALFFPERRPFFLEGADIFSMPLTAVFTRQVADPSWGAKLTGKQGKNAIGVFVAEDEVTNLIFPGAQGSDTTSLDLKSRDAVVRYRRDVGDSSAIGFLLTGREGDDYSNGVAGVDGLYRVNDTNSVRFQYMASETEYPTAVAEEFGQPLDSFSDQAFTLRYNHDSRNWIGYGQYTDVGADFRADMGFIPRGDRTFLLAGVQRVWWGEEGQWFNKLKIGGDWDRTENQAGELLEEERELFFTYDGPKQSNLFVGPGSRRRVFNGEVFDEEYLGVYFEIEPTGDLFFGLWTRVGDDIDFANTRPAEVFVFEPTIRYNLGLRTKISLSYDLFRLDVDEGRLLEAGLSQLRVVYQFTPRMFVRTILQHTDVTRNAALYDDPVEPEVEDLFSQLLFSYKLNPQTVFFLGYGESREADQQISLTERDRSLFLKIGYAWTL